LLYFTIMTPCKTYTGKVHVIWRYHIVPTTLWKYISPHGDTHAGVNTYMGFKLQVMYYVYTGSYRVFLMH
jgi:hypothetical protein